MKLSAMSSPTAEAMSIILEGLPEDIRMPRGIFEVTGFTICTDAVIGPVIRAKGKYVGVADSPLFLCSRIPCPVDMTKPLKLKWEEC